MEKDLRVWIVKHAEKKGPAPVIARDWPQATVKAAAFWGIPWGANVAQMDLERTMEYRSAICVRCGKAKTALMDEEETGMCMACRKAVETEREQAARAYWRREAIKAKEVAG